jgi:hypothetical protein
VPARSHWVAGSPSSGFHAIVGGLSHAWRGDASSQCGMVQLPAPVDGNGRAENESVIA